MSESIFYYFQFVPRGIDSPEREYGFLITHCIPNDMTHAVVGIDYETLVGVAREIEQQDRIVQFRNVVPRRHAFGAFRPDGRYGQLDKQSAKKVRGERA